MNHSISYFLSISLLIFLCISCNNHREPMVLDYCQMLEDDRSYVNQDKTDMKKFNSDMALRDKLIAHNFDLLMEKTTRDGFPPAHLAGSVQDSCRKMAVQMTLIHTAQSNPKLFFSKDIASTFKKEIDKGNLDSELLKRSSIIAAMTEEFCLDLKPKIESALNLWELDSAILENANFVECD